MEDRRRKSSGPQAIGDVVAGLLARRGYAQTAAAEEMSEAWSAAAGAVFADVTRAGNVRRGELEVFVKDSAALQELTFIQTELLRKMAAALPDRGVQKIRFRIGAVD